MKYIKQITIIFTISFIGELCRILLPLPIPASVYGLIILFTLLLLKIVKVKDVKEIADFLIANMAIMFVGPAISIITVWPLFKDFVGVYAIIIFVSTLVVMILSGLTTQLMLKKEEKDA